MAVTWTRNQEADLELAGWFSQIIEALDGGVPALLMFCMPMEPLW